jgi:hypothetical protein
MIETEIGMLPPPPPFPKSPDPSSDPSQAGATCAMMPFIGVLYHPLFKFFLYIGQSQHGFRNAHADIITPMIFLLCVKGLTLFKKVAG